MLWSLLLFLLPAFTAACLWFGRPRGCGDRSSTCPSSIASWTFRTSAWRPSSLFFCLSGRGIGWPPSIFGRRIFKFLCIRNLIASCALWLMAALTNSKRCASVCPRPHRSSLRLWLLFPLFFIPWVSICVVTWTTDSSRPHLGRLSSGISGLSCPSVGDRDQPGEVQLLSVSGGTVSPGGHRRKDFYGLSIARLRLQTAVNLRCISGLRSASCQFVPVASGDAILSVASGSRGPLADEIAPDLPSPLVGSVGSFGSGAVVSGLSSGPSVVASRGSPLSRCVSPSGVPRSGLLVRRFRRRLGAHL